MPLDIDFMPSYDRDSIIAEMRRIAAITGKNHVAVRDFHRFGRVAAHTVTLKFGSLEKAHAAAGLHSSHLKKYSNEDLLKSLADVWAQTLRDHGRSPVSADLKKYGFPVSSRTITERFGSWNEALIATSEASYGRIPSTRPGKSNCRRVPISHNTRFLVFKRDRYTCQICRKSGVELALDHIIPLSQGGSNDIDNLQALCVPCNHGKGGKLQ